MANMGTIAGMLAQSGANIGQAIGAPVQRFGQNIGGMLSQRAEDRRTGEKEAEAKALIEQYRDNPAQLMAIAQEYAIKQDPLAQVFASAAQTSRAKREREMAGLDASRAFAKERAGAARERVDAMGAELERTRLEQNAIKKARATGDENIVSALRNSDANTLRSYLMQKPGERKTSVLSAGSRIVDTATGEVIAQAPFNPAEPKEAKVNFQKRDDGSILVFSGTELVQTIEPPKEEGDQDAAMRLVTKSVYLQDQVDRLSKNIGFFEAGLSGQLFSMAGGTAAYDRDRDIINLKANLGLDQINEMKRLAAESGASGTGLGQVSNIEFMSLQSTVDALDVGMSEEAQIEALANIKKHLKVTQMLASGVAPKDAVDWNSETYKANGYHKDTVTGNVFYAPDGKNGQVYILQDGKFVKARVF
jgi:hypothetical protein